MSTEKLTWYVARSGGIVAWCLLALALIWGLLLSSRLLGRRSSPAWLLAIHRNAGGLSVIFTAVHVAAIMLDDFVDFGWSEVLIPMSSEWRPGAVAWGIVGMYLLIAIEVTSLAMRWLPKKLWRGVHWMSAGLFGFATLHGWQSGTDTGRAFIAATIGVIAILTVLSIVRVMRARRQPVSSDRLKMLASLRARNSAASSTPVDDAEPSALPDWITQADEEWAVPEPVRAATSLTPDASARTPAPSTTAPSASPLLLDDLAGPRSSQSPAFDDVVEDLELDSEPIWPDIESATASWLAADDSIDREVGPVDGVWKRRQHV